MNNSFFYYLHRLELIAFFAGYPMIYGIVLLIAGNPQQRNDLKKTIVSLLPYSYALVGTLYVGFELRNLYPNYSIKEFAPHPFLFVWGVLAMIFWIGALTKRPGIALFHSLVFFILLVSDLFFSESAASGSRDTIRNDMKLYSASILLNSLSFITVTVIYYLLRWLRSVRRSSHFLH